MREENVRFCKKCHVAPLPKSARVCAACMPAYLEDRRVRRNKRVRESRPSRAGRRSMPLLARRYCQRCDAGPLPKSAQICDACIPVRAAELRECKRKRERECYQRKREQRACRCGGPLPTTKWSHVCGVCKLTNKNKGNSKHRHRARRYGVEYDPAVTLARLVARDGSTCKLCRKPVKRCSGHSSNQATIGHIVAISAGGSHTFTNTQVECRACNLAKRTRALGQFVLL